MTLESLTKVTFVGLYKEICADLAAGPPSWCYLSRTGFSFHSKGLSSKGEQCSNCYAGLHLSPGLQNLGSILTEKNHSAQFWDLKLPNGYPTVSRGPGLRVQASAAGTYRRVPSPNYGERVQPDAPKVEQGKFSYELENIINELSALAPRGSISKAMESYKKKLTMQDFSLIFREFARRGDWQRAFRLFKYMQRQSWCKPTEHIYTIMIGIMGREGMLDKASELFEEMPANDVDWNVYSFTALINAYGRNGQYETSLDLLERMKRADVAPNLITYNTVINACAKGGLEWEGLLDLFAQMRYEGIQPDLITYNTLLSACSNRGLVEEAGMVFRTLNEAGVVPDTVTYTSLVDTYERAGDLSMAQQLLREMEDAGNVPDVIGYNVLIDAFSRNGQYQDAELVLKQMQRAGCVPNVETYGMLLEAYGEHGRYEEVRRMVTEMKERGIEPDVLTYNTLLDVFGKGGYFKEAVSLYEDVLDGGLDPDMATYSGLLFACGRGGLHAKAREIYRHMQATGVVPTQEMFVSLINAYGKAGLYSEAAATLISVEETGSKMPLDSFNALVDAYAVGGLCDEAAATIVGMAQHAGVMPSVDTFSSMVEAYAKAGQFKRGLNLHQEMVEAGHESSESTLASLLAVYCGAGMLEEARAQFLEMQAAGMLPDEGTYCLLLSLFARRARWDDCGRLVEEMRKFSMPEEHRFVRELLTGDLDSGYNWQRVDFFLDEMKVEGIGSNMKMYNAVLEALWHLGLHHRAARFLASVRQRGVFPEAVRQSSTIWAVDLHRMSTGAATAMLLTWLQEMQTAVMVGEPLPPLVCIVTKWGEQKQPTEEWSAIPVRKAVHATLQRMEAPFRAAPWNLGRLVCTEAELKGWLLQPDTSEKLALVDSPIPLGQASKSNTIRLRDSSVSGVTQATQRHLG